MSARESCQIQNPEFGIRTPKSLQKEDVRSRAFFFSQLVFSGGDDFLVLDVLTVSGTTVSPRVTIG